MVVRRTKIKDALEGNQGELERRGGGEGGQFFERVALSSCVGLPYWVNIVSFRSPLMKDLMHENIAFEF